MGKTWVRGAFHAVVAVVYTWPLVLRLGDGLPNGTETPGTVAYFNLWTLRWNQQQIGDLYRNYWDAPIFHPESGAFALSEPQPLTGLVFAPISWLSGSHVLAYNLVLLLAVTLNGLAAARLARRVGAQPWPAALAGAVAQFLPFVTNELGVLQLVMVFPVLYTVEAILAWADDDRMVRALAIGGWLTVTFLTCGYYGLFTVTVVGPAALLLVRRSWFRPRRLFQILAAVGLFAVTSGPLLATQSHYTSAFSRPANLVRGNSASPVSYFRLDDSVQGYRVTPGLNHEGGERLYPGTMLVVTAVAGSAVMATRRRWASLAFLLGIAVLGGLLSMGLRLSIFGWEPYELVRQHLPGYADLRSPFRAGLYVQLAFVPLAGVALDALWRIGRRVPAAPAAAMDDQSPDAEVDARAAPPVPVPAFALGAAALGDEVFGDEVFVDAAGGPGESGAPGRPSGEGPAPGGPWSGAAGDPPAAPPPAPSRRPAWLGPALAVALVVIGLAEVHPGEQPLAAVPRSGPDVDWIAWLAEHHETPVGDGSVAMVPFPVNGNYISYEPTTVWMLAGLEHGHPLVNGYSGFFPSAYDRTEDEVREAFPTPSAIQALASHGVTWVVMDRNTVTALDPHIMPAWSDVLRPRFEGEEAIVYELHAEAL